MPHAKFDADPFRNVIFHKERRTDMHTGRQTDSVYSERGLIAICYCLSICR